MYKIKAIWKSQYAVINVHTGLAHSAWKCIREARKMMNDLNSNPRNEC